METNIQSGRFSLWEVLRPLSLPVLETMKFKPRLLQNPWEDSVLSRNADWTFVDYPSLRSLTIEDPSRDKSLLPALEEEFRLFLDRIPVLATLYLSGNMGSSSLIRAVEGTSSEINVLTINDYSTSTDKITEVLRARKENGLKPRRLHYTGQLYDVDTDDVLNIWKILADEVYLGQI